MRTILKFSTAIAGVICACAILLRAHAQVPAAQLDTERIKWVERCLRDFESIKPGMARAEIEGKFRMDGGLQSVSPVRFVHPECAYFKIDVEFDFKRNASDQGRAIWSKDDKAAKISKPYIERPIVD